MRSNTLGISSIFDEAGRDATSMIFVMVLLTQETSLKGTINSEGKPARVAQIKALGAAKLACTYKRIVF